MDEQLEFDAKYHAKEEDCPESASPEEFAGDAKDFEESAEPSKESEPAEEPEKTLAEYSPYEIGEKGEQLAADYLARRGYKIIQRNWRCKGGGEADIIARDGETYVMVEVKTRRVTKNDANLMPELAVTAHKQRTYRKMALLYLAYHAHVSVIRFDVIAINLAAERSASLRHLIGAFSWDEND